MFSIANNFLTAIVKNLTHYYLWVIELFMEIIISLV